MFDLTSQEKKAIIFLASLALLSLGANFALKANCKVGRYLVEITGLQSWGVA